MGTKSPNEIKSRESELYAFDVENIKGTIRTLEHILANPNIDEGMLTRLSSVEVEITILRKQITYRLIALLKKGYQLD